MTLVVDRCRHGRKLCTECIVVDDAAKRAYDIAKGLAIFTDWDTRTRGTPYLAIRLEDGGSDQRLYASRAEAMRHQPWPDRCAYLSYRDAPNGFATPKDAACFLAWNRAAYDAGMRLPDPDDRLGGPELVMPASTEHFRNQLKRLVN